MVLKNDLKYQFAVLLKQQKIKLLFYSGLLE